MNLFEIKEEKLKYFPSYYPLILSDVQKVIGVQKKLQNIEWLPRIKYKRITNRRKFILFLCFFFLTRITWRE